MKLFLIVLCLASAPSFAQSFRTSSPVLQNVMTEVMAILPSSFKENLPAELEVNTENFDEIPDDLCGDLQTPFTWGKYSVLKKKLIINQSLIKEFAKGRNSSRAISCQHKNIYDQGIATIVHELGHAYDMKTGFPSRSKEFANIATFSKGLFRAKSLNTHPLRSPDQYETTALKEAFAVNLEYFIMDEEFACRRPVMFRYFKDLFGHEPFKNRSCKVNRTVMINTSTGLYPVELDPARIYRIDYLLASSGSDISSGFGHSMYRIVYCNPEYTDPITGKKVAATPYGPECLKDKLSHLVVSYRANVSNSTLNYLKGLTGGYASQLYILTLPSVIEEYNRTELRDLTAYPLKLSASQKTEFLNRVVEEHWQYRGSYKFINSNCATESLRIIRNSLPKDGLLPTITPVGVRHVLRTSGLIDMNDPGIELMKARGDYLLAAWNLAYGKKIEDNKKLMKALESSDAHSRNELYSRTLHAKFTQDLKGLTAMKKTLVKLASFSVIENQILRIKADTLKKKIGELIKDTKTLESIPAVKEVMDEMRRSSELEDLSGSGYGIPSAEEMKTIQTKNISVENAAELKAKTEQLIASTFPSETAELKSLVEGIHQMNDGAINFRENFRTELKDFVAHELQKLAGTHATLPDDASGIRKLIGEDLLSKKEVSDETLLKILRETLPQ